LGQAVAVPEDSEMQILRQSYVQGQKPLLECLSIGPVRASEHNANTARQPFRLDFLTGFHK
jgi:hypothetical protein